MAQIARLKAAEISPGNTIAAADLEAELDQLVSNDNSQDTRITNIESGNVTISGNKTFSGEVTFSSATNPVKTNQIDERTAAAGVTIDSVLCKDGSIRIPGSSGYTPAADGDLGYDTAKDLFLTYDGAVKPVALSGGVNAQTGTTYTVVAGDRNKLVTLSNASSIAVTLPQAGSTGFANNYTTTFVSLGAGTVTITPTTSTIDGASSITLTQNQGIQVFSDGTNYFTNRGRTASSVLNLISTQSPSAASAVSFTSNINSTYNTYVVEIPYLTISADGYLYIEVTDDGGSSWKATNYKAFLYLQDSDNTTANVFPASGASTTTNILIGSTTAGYLQEADAGYSYSGTIKFRIPANTSLYKHFEIEATVTTNAVNKQIARVHGRGEWRGGTGAINGFRIVPSTGTVTGVVSLYGISS